LRYDIFAQDPVYRKRNIAHPTQLIPASCTMLSLAMRGQASTRVTGADQRHRGVIRSRIVHVPRRSPSPTYAASSRNTDPPRTYTEAVAQARQALRLARGNPQADHPLTRLTVELPVPPPKTFALPGSLFLSATRDATSPPPPQPASNICTCTIYWNDNILGIILKSKRTGGSFIFEDLTNKYGYNITK
jgi:hypothetical protein